MEGKKNQTRRLALGAMFCALTAVAAQLIIPLQLVPFTFAMVAVYLTGALLDRRTAFLAQAAYLLLGAAGAPVFSGFSGGVGKLCGPTGGYLVTYPLMAFAIAFLAEKWGRGFIRYALSMGVALLICYLGGTVWLAVSTRSSIQEAFALGVAPFVPFDLLKILLSAGFSSALQKALSRARLLPVSAGHGRRG